MLRGRQKLTAFFFYFTFTQTLPNLDHRVFGVTNLHAGNANMKACEDSPAEKIPANLRFRIFDGHIANSTISEFEKYGVQETNNERIYYLHRDTSHNLNCRPQRHATELGPKACFLS